jgi:hypothetical protein
MARPRLPAQVDGRTALDEAIERARPYSPPATSRAGVQPCVEEELEAFASLLASRFTVYAPRLRAGAGRAG